MVLCLDWPPGYVARAYPIIYTDILKEVNPSDGSFMFLSLLAMCVQTSNFVVLNDEDLVLVSDVLYFIRSCVINVC